MITNTPRATIATHRTMSRRDINLCHNLERSLLRSGTREFRLSVFDASCEKKYNDRNEFRTFETLYLLATYVNALFPCPVFTDTLVTSAGAPLVEAPGVAQSGSP